MLTNARALNVNKVHTKRFIQSRRNEHYHNMTLTQSLFAIDAPEFTRPMSVAITTQKNRQQHRNPREKLRSMRTKLALP